MRHSERTLEKRYKSLLVPGSTILTLCDHPGPTQVGGTVAPMDIPLSTENEQPRVERGAVPPVSFSVWDITVGNCYMW
jgi:hypothetical protein